MKTYIYKSRKKDEMYLYLAVQDDFSDVPEALLASLGDPPIYIMELELNEDRKLAREDVKKVLQNLHTQGFHLQMPPTAGLLLERERAGKPH